MNRYGDYTSGDGSTEKQEESDWEVQSKTGPGVMYNFGELRGIKGLKKSQRLEIMPYTLGELNTMERNPESF